MFDTLSSLSFRPFSAMTMSKSSAEGITTRAYAPRTPTYQRFHPNATTGISSGGSVGAGGGSNPYARQYSHVYSARLTALRSRCLDEAYRSIRDGSVIITNDEVGGGKNNSSNDIMKEITTAERIIEAPDSSWSILVGTVVREVHPDRRMQHTSPSSIMDAHSFLFPPTTAATKKNGKAIVEPLRTQIMFDARAGDILHLEDESGRVELETDDTVSFNEGNEYALDPNALVTGVVIAVVGRVDGARGVMKVRSVHFAGPPRSSSFTNDENDATTPRGRGVLRGPTVIHGTIDGDGMEGDDEDDGPYLLLISGLGCGADSPTDLESGTSLAVRREMLLEYLTNPTLSDGSSICRVIVAGGGVAPPVIDDGEDDDQDGVDGGGGGETTTANGNKRKNYNIEASAKSSSIKTKTTDAANRVASSLAELDIYLSEILACGIPVDFVPGYHDPTNANWPQRPIHPCLLPRSCGYVDLFGRGTNPYECILGSDENEVGSYGGVRVLGSDGLNVADLRRFLVTKKKDVVTTATDDDDDETAGVSSSIDALNRTLVYGHVAPTGPDSLPTFPSSECDPFVLSSRPDVYFAGNCEQFETRLVDSRGNAIDDSTVLASGTDDEGAMTRLVCVPSFSLTGEVVLVKLKTLECEVMSFNDLTL